MQKNNQISNTQKQKSIISVYKPQSPFERLRNSCQNSHEALYKAVILQAIIDASGFYLERHKCAKKNIKAYRDAYYWIFGKKMRGEIRFEIWRYSDLKTEKQKNFDENDLKYIENSFEDICQKAGLEIKATRDAAEKIIKNHNKDLYRTFML